MKIVCVCFSLVCFFSELYGSELTEGVKGYKKAVEDAGKSEKKFATFRQDHAIKIVYEHVDLILGEKYVNKIYHSFPILMQNISKLIKNDKFGKPKLDYYEHIGMVAGTTLRYIFILGEMMDLFDLKENSKIVEIGCGYGGQCSVLSQMIDFSSYKLIDLDFVLPLIDRYLTAMGVQNFQTLNPSQCSEYEEYDLFISNYGISECYRHEQDDYIENVIKHAKRGYIIYNNIAKDLVNNYSAHEFFQKLKEVGIKPEIKLEAIQTYPSNPNYLIYWGAEE